MTEALIRVVILVQQDLIHLILQGDMCRVLDAQQVLIQMLVQMLV